MRTLRVLTPVIGATLAASLVAAPSWATPVAAPDGATQAAAAGVTTSATALPGATIPAIDFRFVAGEGAAPLVTRAGFLAVTATLGLKCGFNGVWTDYSAAVLANLRRPYLLKKKVPPKFTFNVVASIGCAPLAGEKGDGSVKFLVNGKQFAAKNLTWKASPGARPGLPLLKFATNANITVFSALKARIAKTPGGIPIATSPTGRADCRLVAGWWGFDTDAFPASPRVAYRVPAAGWLAVACRPLTNTAGSTVVLPGNGAAARAVSWGAFTPYAPPPPAPIPAFEMGFPNAPVDAPGKMNVVVTPLGKTAAGAVVCSISSMSYKPTAPKTMLVGMACIPSSWRGGSIRVTLRYGTTNVATIDRTWADVKSPKRPLLPAVLVALPGWPDISKLAAKREVSAASAAGTGAGAARVSASTTAADVVEMSKIIDGITVRLKLAREGRDVVKVLCLDEKLSQANVSQHAAQTMAARFEQTFLASGRRDVEAEQYDEATKRAVWDRLKQIETESTQCLGEEVSFTGGTKTVIEIYGNLPGGAPLPPGSSLPIDIPAYTPPAPPVPSDDLGKAEWWHFTVPQDFAHPDVAPVKWPSATAAAPISVRVNCPALSEQECADEVTRVRAAAGAIVAEGGPQLRVEDKVSASKFTPHNVAAGKPHTDPSLQGGISITFTKPGEIKKNPNGTWFRKDGNVELLPGQLEQGYTDIFYDRVVFENAPMPSERGVGGFDWAGDRAASAAKIVAGYVAIDGPSLAALPPWKRQALYMHELGHAIGLTHPDQTQTFPGGLTNPAEVGSMGQIMDSKIDVPEARWGNGDKAGLRRVGGGS